jgi:hypothetical protein
LQSLICIIVHDVDGASAIHEGFGEPQVSDLQLDDQCDSPWVLDLGSVICAALGYALLGPVEPVWDVNDDCVDSDCAGEDLHVMFVVDPSEGLDRLGGATEIFICGLVLVFVFVPAAVSVAAFFGMPRFLNLLERATFGGGMRVGLPLFVVVDVGLVEEPCGGEFPTGHAIVSRAAVVTANALRVTMVVPNVVDEIEAVVILVLATTWAIATEVIVITATVVPSGMKIALRTEVIVAVTQHTTS